jgi:uncharacterized protein (DUF488 family)
MLTLGHGTLEVDEFVALARGASVDLIVDVRRYPGSRRHPHVARDAMAAWLPANGIAYEWMPELGGRRKPTSESPNIALRNDQFRAYADHMATDEFAGAVAHLLERVRDHTAAVMCAESLWWRCHRRLLADYLTLVRAVDVGHLFHDGRIEPHSPMPEATVVEGRLVYRPAQDALWGDA